MPEPTKPKITVDKLYGNIRLGLLLVSGSDMNFMERAVINSASKLSPSEKEDYLQKWEVVKARLKAEGYV